MAVVIERTFVGGNAGTVRGLQLGNEEYIRRMTVGSDWTKLRIAALVNIAHTATIPGILDIGVCSGRAGGIGSGSPLNYVGVGIGGGNATRTGTPAIVYATQAGWGYSNTNSSSGAGYVGWHCQAQQGATISGYARSNGYFGPMYNPAGDLVGGSYRRGIVVADFQRSSNTTCLFAINVALAANGVSLDYDYEAMMAVSENQHCATDSELRGLVGYNQAASVFVATASRSFINGIATSLTYSTAAGPLDSVNIAWNLHSNYCLLWGVAVTQYA